MIEFWRSVLTSQFEASLCMLHHGIKNCPAEFWHERMATDTVQQTTYHTLFFVDLYLSREDTFVKRELHQRGGDEEGPGVSIGLPQDETLEYVAICRQKARDTIAAETMESLMGPSGFSYRKISRGELHLYNIRHIQHHTGQLSSFLRRVADTSSPWIGSGWR